MSKYGKYVVTELKAPFTPAYEKEYQKFATRILWMDNKVVPGAFQMNCSWYRAPSFDHGAAAHQHDVDEIIGFFSSDPKNPYDLGAEVEIWLEDQQFILTKSTMLFVPGGMNHCPLILRRVDRPIFHYSVVTGGQYTQQKIDKHVKISGKLDKYVVSDLRQPEDRKQIEPVYNKYARRILWMDKDVVPGAFQMNTSWYLKASETIDNKPHVHQSDEIIGFFSNDPNNPHDLDAEVEIYLEGEKQTITKSTMIFVPAGMTHCPLTLKRVGRPIFHFTVVTSPIYTRVEK